MKQHSFKQSLCFPLGTLVRHQRTCPALVLTFPDVAGKNTVNLVPATPICLTRASVLASLSPKLVVLNDEQCKNNWNSPAPRWLCLTLVNRCLGMFRPESVSASKPPPFTYPANMQNDVN